MTYGEFMRQLYHSLRGLVADAGDVELGILDQHMDLQREEDRKVRQTVELWKKRKARSAAGEDILYAVIGRGEKTKILFWQLRELYQSYRMEGWQSVLPTLAWEIGREAGSHGERGGELILRPVSLMRDKKGLEDSIYWQQGDLALVLFRFMNCNPLEPVAVKVSASGGEFWQQDRDTLLTRALLNSCRVMPPRLYHGQDRLCYYDERGGVFMPNEKGIPIGIDRYDRVEGLVGYRLTTVCRSYGAIALFYAGVKERIGELLGGDYYVGFTSVHEAVIHSVRHKHLSDLKETIQHNNILLGDKEVLSGRVYRYLCRRGELVEV